MFCKKSLGSNDVVEEFPVGRRLAFDAARGRLWVVCRRCERWNLSPLEERWEAVETCERLFRGTRVRTSSANIGLARHPEGLELVRIGKPLRPEFAAWRYGDQFGRRRRRAAVFGTVAGAASVGGMALGGWMVGLGGLGVGSLIYRSIEAWQTFRPSAFFRPEDGDLRWMNGFGIRRARLVPASDETGFSVEARSRSVLTEKKERFEGQDAVRVLRAILPRVNAKGGRLTTVQSAVRRIEYAGNPHRFVRRLARRHQYYSAGQMRALEGPARLALEMALHEEQERRALEGELWRLEQAWREAEEIAAIADRLLLPEGAARLLDQHSGRDPGQTPDPTRPSEPARPEPER